MYLYHIINEVHLIRQAPSDNWTSNLSAVSDKILEIGKTEGNAEVNRILDVHYPEGKNITTESRIIFIHCKHTELKSIFALIVAYLLMPDATTKATVELVAILPLQVCMKSFTYTHITHTHIHIDGTLILYCVLLFPRKQMCWKKKLQPTI